MPDILKCECENLKPEDCRLVCKACGGELISDSKDFRNLTKEQMELLEEFWAVLDRRDEMRKNRKDLQVIADEAEELITKIDPETATEADVNRAINTTVAMLNYRKQYAEFQNQTIAFVQKLKP